MPDRSKQAIINICQSILRELADADGNMYTAINVLLQNPETKQRLSIKIKELHNTIKICQPTIKKPR